MASSFKKHNKNLNRRNPSTSIYNDSFSVIISRIFIQLGREKNCFDWQRILFIFSLRSSAGGVQLSSITAIIRKSAPSLLLNLDTPPPPKKKVFCPFEFEISNIWFIFLYNFLSICLMKGRRTGDCEWLLERMFALKSLNIWHPPPSSSAPAGRSQTEI